MKSVTFGSAVMSLLCCFVLVSSANAQPPEGTVLPRGTEIKAVVAQNLSVEKNSTGGKVYFRVTEDVTIAGKLVILHGTLIHGRVGDVKRGKGLSKRGELTIHAESTTAIDGSRVPIEKTGLGPMGNTAEGSALHSSILWGGLSVHSKHRPSYVLNGTPYILTTAEDVTVYPDLPTQEPRREQNTIRMAGHVDDDQKVKLFKGRSSEDLLNITIELPQRVSKKQAKLGFGPDDVVLVRMMETDLPVPIDSVLVSVKKKKIEASFQAWEVLQYAVPGKIGLVIQVEMGGGQMGEVDVVLDTKFAL